jgi:hypothetical protein
MPATPSSSRAVRGRLAGVKVKGTAVAADRTAAVILASEGRPFTPASIDRAAELAKDAGGTVLVVSIARVHGAAFGLQTPGLMPTKAEWDEQRTNVDRAITRLRRRGVRAEGQVLGTRKVAPRVCALAAEVGAADIVMAADPARSRLITGMLWSQEPQAVARRAKVEVHLVTDGG